MKKTLIALMALAGVACGAIPGVSADSFNGYIDEIAADNGYTQNGAYALTINFDDVDYKQGLMVSLADDYHMILYYDNNSGWHNGKQIGIVGVTSKSDRFSGIYDKNGIEVNPSIVTDSTILSADTTNKVNTWTTTSGNYLYSWIATDPQAVVSTMKNDYKYVEGSTLTINCNGEDTTVSMKFNGSITSTIILTDVCLDLTDIELSSSTVSLASGTLALNGTTYTIPEPATATLSLLALAGLAARRRRR